MHASVHMAQQTSSWIGNQEKRERIIKTIIVFAYACKAQLKDKSLKDESGDDLVKKNVISRKELDAMCRQTGSQSYYCLEVMRAVMNDALANKEDIKIHESFRNAAYVSFEETSRDLALGIVGCMRVKTTGLPVQYDSLVKLVMFIFYILIAFSWSGTSMGWLTPIAIYAIAIPMTIMINLGTMLQDPFGDDIVDLPLEKYCKKIEHEVHAVALRSFNDYNLVTGLDTTCVE